jgi:hypothetical protein
MAQPDAQPVEEYEYVWHSASSHIKSLRCTDTKRVLDSYESLPPNFSLLQNMVAGAFAGIAVRQRQEPE